MKIAKVKTEITGNRLVFKLQGTPQEVAFNDVKGMGENLKNLNRQLYFIRKSKKSEISSVMGKRFK